jgi:hypothetical protein
VGRRIQDGKLALIGPCIVKNRRKTAGMGGDHNRQLGLAPVAPLGGRSLRVKIDNQGIKIILHGRNGQMQGECGFPGPAFL